MSSWDAISATFLSNTSSSSSASSTTANSAPSIPVNIFKKKPPTTPNDRKLPNTTSASRPTGPLPRQPSSSKPTNVPPKSKVQMGNLFRTQSTTTGINYNTSSSLLAVNNRSAKNAAPKPFQTTGAVDKSTIHHAPDSAPATPASAPKVSSTADAARSILATAGITTRLNDGAITDTSSQQITHPVPPNPRRLSIPNTTPSTTTKDYNISVTAKHKQQNSPLLSRQDGDVPALQKASLPSQRPSLQTPISTIKNPQTTHQPLKIPMIKPPALQIIQPVLPLQQLQQSKQQKVVPLLPKNTVEQPPPPVFPHNKPTSPSTDHPPSWVRQLPQSMADNTPKLCGDHTVFDLEELSRRERAWRERGCQHQRYISEVIQADANAETALNTEMDKIDHFIRQLRAETARTTAKSIANHQTLLQSLRPTTSHPTPLPREQSTRPSPSLFKSHVNNNTMIQQDESRIVSDDSIIPLTMTSVSNSAIMRYQEAYFRVSNDNDDDASGSNGGESPRRATSDGSMIVDDGSKIGDMEEEGDIIGTRDVIDLEQDFGV
ncbi:hypothetical protein SeMB42_g05460 [Synchytrium endobioticum]|uniref:Uncharacterized protein n=1 Tax=Synchytrium endobioticum TaxID=286115 RepID=A0A507CLT8_9FUNG|nr:hypothetical protein SeLEV6574_g06980 [Synchytrium endobioticum]TPX41687.1 hypothetical protein SeMB42_g05460 [Synchytrium endobioticum]